MPRLPCLARHLPRARSRAWQGLGVALCWGAMAGAAHADLWAYVDARGVTHFSAEPMDERYQLYFRGAIYDSAAQGLQAPGDARRAEQSLLARAKVQSFFDISPGYKSVRSHLRRAAEHTGVDYALLKAVIAVESGFDPQAISPKGAIGLMQIMPATAQRFGVSAQGTRSISQQLADPAINVPTGARYLRYLSGLFPGRLDLVLAAYNAGEGAVRRAGQAIPPYRETRNYVQAVMGLYEHLQPPGEASVLRPAAEAGTGRTGTPRLRMTLPTGLPVADEALPALPD